MQPSLGSEGPIFQPGTFQDLDDKVFSVGAVAQVETKGDFSSENPCLGLFPGDAQRLPQRVDAPVPVRLVVGDP